MQSVGVGPPKEPAIDVAAARHSLIAAWASYRQSTIQHFRQGLDFGLGCYEWRTKYKAQGSHKGKRFDHLLGTIGIPKTTAYRWIQRYEMKSEMQIRNNIGNFQSDKVTSSRFFLTSERRRQFEDDVNTLGGPESVSQMFLDFLARAPFEKRQRIGVVLKTTCSAADYNCTA